MKTIVKIYNLLPLPWRLWGIKSSSRDIVIKLFAYAEQNGYLKILIR